MKEKTEHCCLTVMMAICLILFGWAGTSLAYVVFNPEPAKQVQWVVAKDWWRTHTDRPVFSLDVIPSAKLKSGTEIGRAPVGDVCAGFAKTGRTSKTTWRYYRQPFYSGLDERRGRVLCEVVK